MKKITTKIGTRGVFFEEDAQEISDAGDIVEILDYPDKGSSLVFISVQNNDSEDICSVCDMPRCPNGKGGEGRLCACIKFRCTSNYTGVCFKQIDTMLENL